MKKQLYVGALLCSLGGVAAAMSMPTGNFFVSANIGAGGMVMPSAATSFVSANSNVLTFNSKNERGFLWGVGAGYLANMPKNFSLGAEISYENWNNNKYSIHNSTGSGSDTVFNYSGYPINFMAIGMYHFNKLLSADIKAGIAYQHQKVTVSGAQNLSKSDSALLPKIGVGLNYNFTDKIVTSVTYEHAFGSTISTSDINAVTSSNEFTFGISYMI